MNIFLINNKSGLIPAPGKAKIGQRFRGTA